MASMKMERIAIYQRMSQDDLISASTIDSLMSNNIGNIGMIQEFALLALSKEDFQELLKDNNGDIQLTKAQVAAKFNAQLNSLAQVYLPIHASPKMNSLQQSPVNPKAGEVLNQASSELQSFIKVIGQSDDPNAGNKVQEKEYQQENNYEAEKKHENIEPLPEIQQGSQQIEAKRESTSLRRHLESKQSSRRVKPKVIKAFKSKKIEISEEKKERQRSVIFKVPKRSTFKKSLPKEFERNKIKLNFSMMTNK